MVNLKLTSSSHNTNITPQSHKSTKARSLSAWVSTWKNMSGMHSLDILLIRIAISRIMIYDSLLHELTT